MAINSEIDRVFELQKAHCDTIRNTSADQRTAKLRRLQDKILANQSLIETALRQDLRKAPQETGLSELYPVLSEIRHACKHLQKWMEPRPLKNPLVFFRANASIRYEPKGMALILSPWNYPFQLALSPVVSAIAAGNCVVLKPSEISSHTSGCIKQILEQTFPQEEVAVFEGDHTVATLLLEKPFHHVFFTGSPAVGKIVMQATAKHLASSTLELGGKSPVIIDEVYDLEDAARKIVWGKMINAGQTCVAPDYLLVPEKREKQFIETAKKYLQQLYKDPKNSPDYCKIISAKHQLRLKKMLTVAVEQGARIEIGGEIEESNQYFAPTIVSNVPADSQIMEEEIFGPILPVLAYRSPEDALQQIHSKPRPLALYIFSNNTSFVKNILDHTHSGGVCINDVAVHFANVELPFGGINNSGIGNSHGYFGFRAFSHERAVLKQPKTGAMTFFYPPYTEKMKKLIQWTVKYF
ncbi:aldehyde dehydrogenase family protein [bacterium]|nr:aldehyde dehydrogenase family protein [bacterium]